MKCGHQEPSTEDTSYLAQSPFPLNNEYQLTLTSDNKAEIIFNNVNKNFGNWTMIYDEGFNIDFDNLSLFAFSKFVKVGMETGKNIYKSQCSSTCVGWMRSPNEELWGCYKAIKKNSD